MTADRPYLDRRSAGRVLARERALLRAANDDPVVLGLPRGGVPVAAEIADAIHAPLDVFVVRKLGLPQQPELAMGAIASGGIQVIDRRLIDSAGVSPAEFARVLQTETRELQRREALYRRGRPPLDLVGRAVIVVDDGLATGSTLRAALTALRRAGCGRITAAAPVGPRMICSELAIEADALICPLQPEPFHAVGLWYENFSPTEDAEVRDCLAHHANHPAA